MLNDRKLFKIKTLKTKMETKKINSERYWKKIARIELMLDELKQEISFLDKEFQEGINRGEEDIRKGRITICRTEKELNNFFASI